MDFTLDERLCAESMRYWRKDLADQPLLYDFIMAVWDKDCVKVEELLHKDSALRQSFLNYMEKAAKTQPNPEVLAVLLSRWLNIRLL